MLMCLCSKFNTILHWHGKLFVFITFIYYMCNFIWFSEYYLCLFLEQDRLPDTPPHAETPPQGINTSDTLQCQADQFLHAVLHKKGNRLYFTHTHTPQASALWCTITGRAIHLTMNNCSSVRFLAQVQRMQKKLTKIMRCITNPDAVKVKITLYITCWLVECNGENAQRNLVPTMCKTRVSN